LNNFPCFLFREIYLLKEKEFIWEERNYMSPKNKSENLNEKTIDCITNDTKSESSKNGWKIIGGKKKWIRKCPKCQNDIIVSSEKYYNESINKNSLCLFCASKSSHKNRGHISKEEKKKISIECPKCNKPRPYYRTILNNRLCKSCAAKNNYPHQKELLLYGILHNRIHGKTIKSKNIERNCPKCNKIIKNTSLHYVNKNKHRLCKSCACKENVRKNNINFPNIPSFNPNACKIIDEYGKQNGYNFQHALNGGEIFIKDLVVWLDGYDKENNVVIECYEPFHYYCDGRLKSKDIIRQEKIINHLKCKLIEIMYDGKSNNIKSIKTFSK